MNITDFNMTQAATTLSALTSACGGDYLSLALGICFLVSEALPFIKMKSGCKNSTEIMPNETNEAAKPPELLSQSQGVLHAAYSFYIASKNRK
mgnify:CR=1 FL=1